MEWKLSSGVLENMNCPNCNSSSIAEILYGYYPNMDSIKDALDKNEVVLGGCIVTDHDPKWECNDCNHRWGERED